MNRGIATASSRACSITMAGGRLGPARHRASPLAAATATHVRSRRAGGLHVRCCQSSSSTAAAAAAAAGGSQQPFTITTPLYYVNAAPHMGSAYPTIAADVLARYQRLAGRRVRFLTGTDEHGEKIALAAAARGLTPQDHCDGVVAAYQALWAALDISHDGFVRTTDPAHEALVGEVLARVWNKGDIYKAAYSGWYCVDCEEYKDEKELVDLSSSSQGATKGASSSSSSAGEGAQHACPTHRKPCQHRSEENYFFALSKYQAQLEALLEGNEAFVQPPARRNEVLGWVREGVRDFSISRSAVSWGIPMPQDPQHTVYVWFDALNGYLSGLLPLGDADGSSNGGSSSSGSSSSLDAVVQQGWPADVHIIGKDILRFHAVYWPGMLMAAGLPLPKQVFGHGFLTKDGLKMGKALGNTLDPAALVATYGPDAVRLYFMKEVTFGKDGNFSEAAFRDTVNACLANSIGNMLNRTLGLLRKSLDSTLPCSALDAAPAGSDHVLRKACEEQVAAAAVAYERMAPHAAVEALLAIAGAANQYVDQQAPWTALKKGSDEEKAAAGRVMVAVLEAGRILAVALSPISPGVASRMYQQLGLGEGPLQGRVTWANTAWGQLQQGHQTAQPQPVFARLDDTVPFVAEPAPAAAAAAAAPVKAR